MTTTTFKNTRVEEASSCRNCACHKAAPAPDKLATVMFLITIVTCAAFIGGIIANLF